MTLIKYEGFDLVGGGVCAPKGFRAAGLHCGIRKNRSKKDLAMICSDTLCSSAAVYTQNLVKGAPIIVTKEHLQNGKAQAVIVNSGNANTCNADGEEKAAAMCELAAKELNIPEEDVIVASTGVIGMVLDLEPIASHAKELAQALSYDGAHDAANAILTTDTQEKEIAVRFELGGKTCTIAGMAKGSGMIHPNMATMLCFLTTDAAIDPEVLQKALSAVVEDTFNMVSIDGDTSTNDMACIMANGLAGNPEINSVESEEYQIFSDALYVALMNLSRMIAGDGEGATKLLECTVTGAADRENAKIVAKSVITSSLFKCAMFGADANWGRILCAIGYSKADLDIHKVEVLLSSQKGSICVCQKGAGVEFSEEKAAEILKEDEIKIVVKLGDGNGKAVAWGCDLTYDYVKINGDYRT
ncbi:bifunctional glutamate N-acetyltransferase/amino-acid acetyltransferase ArgJ [Massiliimalia massiliensis]|jgi:glutamate N-acetyltransferase/amino-acid N-acetyltransferase|uniref:bifunctional glutamate N-acetyltransferase/amino-acid acetyltransferase ArgJ n=1 Tax=Massiliimalia massiliensis TaxID=1852384 RepID=UPI000984BF79|nr:bifunctional glutamate N-acetyltransferase/amino-acid acetyltransferase ArgJ [Massiliimalia massiliensis]